MDTYPGFLTLMFFHNMESDFTVSKVTFGKETPHEIYHMEIDAAWKTVSATLKDVKAEIYAMQQEGHQCFFDVYGIM